MAKIKPDILQREIVAESRIFKVERMQLAFSNGEQRQFERVIGRSKASVLITPVLDNDTFVLIREYAAGVGDYVLGFPKGAVGDGEELLATANRELMEEAGYGAHKLTHLGQLSASPGYVDNVMQFVLAEDLYEKRLPGDEPETIEVILWKFADIDKLLAHPEFHEARSIAALLMVERRLKGK